MGTEIVLKLSVNLKGKEHTMLGDFGFIGAILAAALMVGVWVWAIGSEILEFLKKKDNLATSRPSQKIDQRPMRA
jgi:hypothetical protein